MDRNLRPNDRRRILWLDGQQFRKHKKYNRIPLLRLGHHNPSMLFTYSMYLYHIHNPIDNRTFFQIVDANIFTLFPIFILNTCMLFFGYLAEKGFTDFITGAILGFVPFIVMFKMIYEHYAKESTIGRITFAYFVGVWSLYGFASLFSYTYKNIFYNILDLLSKNVFGIFLAIVLLLSPNK